MPATSAMKIEGTDISFHQKSLILVRGQIADAISLISILNQKDCCHYTSFLARNCRPSEVRKLKITPEVDLHAESLIYISYFFCQNTSYNSRFSPLTVS